MAFRLSHYIFGKYDNKNYVLQQKARVVFSICFASFLLSIYMIIINTYVTKVPLLETLPIIVIAFTLLFFCWMIKNGNYAITAHLMIIAMFLTVWVVMFISTDTLPVDKVDSIVFIFGALAITPIVITEKKQGILFYYSANIILLILFSFHLLEFDFFTTDVVVEYFTDNFVVMLLATIISYQIFKINKGALDIAHDTAVNLRAERDYSHTVIDNSPVIICSMSNDGIFDSVNPAFKKITGRSADYLITKKWREVFSSYNEIKGLDKIKTFETTITSSDNSQKIIIWNITKRTDEAGTINGTILFGIDVTSQKNAETKIIAMNKGLEASIRQRTSELEKSNLTMREVTDKTRILVNTARMENEKNTIIISKLSNEAVDLAETGVEKMAEMKKSMSAISDVGNRIANINKTIDDIAFQTNLLALNAAVEAARAGKHGKGFAVVAQEVRTLAARSAKASNETSDLIENTINLVQNGDTIAQSTAASLDEINDSVKKLKAIVSDVTEASNNKVNEIAAVNRKLVKS